MAIVYKIGFKTDAEGISSQLATIQKDIEQAFKRGGSALNSELAEGIKQAGILSDVLQKAQTEKGTSFIAMNKALMQAGTSASQMVGALSSAGMKQSLNTFLQTFAAADRNLIGISAKVKEMQRVLTQSVKFNFAMGLQNFVMGQVQGAIGWARDLNKALTEIAVVAPEVAHKLDKVGESIINNSRALRVSAQDYAEAALIFYQQGLDPAEVERRTELVIKSAAASGQAVKEMSEQLTAVWNTYQMEGDELERAAAVAAKLGAETAAAFEDIAVGMQIAASGASMLGVSYDSLAAIMTTVRETTQQSASTIGNAYKTIFARFSNLKTTGEDAGESLGRITQQLADMGVNVLDQSGQLRDLDDVIMQLGTSWDSYGRKQQIAIAQVVGGVRQYQQFLALMQNFDKYQANLASAQGVVDGSELTRQYAETLKSVDSMMINATEAWRRAFGQVFTDDAQITFYKTLENIGNVVGDIITHLGGLQGIMVIIGALLLQKIAPMIRDIGFGIKQWAQNLTVSGQFKAISKEAEAMRNNLIQLQSSGVDTSADQQKVNLYEQASKQHVVLNRLISEGNAETRIRAEYLKNQAIAAQESGDAALDELDTLKKTNIVLADQLAMRAQKAMEAVPEQQVIEDLSLQEAQGQGDLDLEQAKLELIKQQVIENQSLVNLATQEVAEKELALQTAADELATLEASGTASAQELSVAKAKVTAAQQGLQSAQQSLSGMQASLSASKQQLTTAQQIVNTKKEELRAIQQNLAAARQAANEEPKKAAALKTSSDLLKAAGQYTRDLVEGTKTSAAAAVDLATEFAGAASEITETSEEAETLKQALNEAAIALVSGNGDLESNFQNISAALRDYNAEAGNTGPMMDQVSEALTNTGSATDELITAQQRLTENQRLVNEATQNSRMSMTSFFSELGKLAGGLTMTTMGIDNLSTMIKNGEHSLGGYISALMQIVPGLTMMGKSIFQVIAGLMKQTTASLTSAIATKAASIANISAGATAAGATPPLWAMAAAFIAMSWPILLIIGLIAALALGIMAFLKAEQKKKEALIEGTEATSKAAAANIELRDSLTDVVNSLQTANKQFQEGTLSYAEFREEVAKARAELVALSNTDAGSFLDDNWFMEFDAAPFERQMQMISEATSQASQAAIDNANAAQEYMQELHSEGMKRGDSGDERAFDDLVAAARNAGIDIENEFGNIDLTKLAENEAAVLQNMSSVQRSAVQEMMAEWDGYVEYTTAVAARGAAEIRETFNQMLIPGDDAATQSNILEAMGLAATNQEALQGLQSDASEASRIIEDAQARIDEIRATSVDGYYTQAQLDELRELNTTIADATTSRNMVMQQISDITSSGALNYSDLIAEINASGNESARNTMQAIQIMAQNSGISIRQVTEAFSNSTADLEQAVKLVEMGMESLLTLNGNELLISLVFEDSALGGMQARLDEFKADLSAGEKIAWLDETNESIARYNELMNEMNGTDGVEYIGALGEEFLRLGGSAQEAYVATLQEQMALLETANMHNQLNAVQEEKSRILQEIGITEQATTQATIQAARDQVEANISVAEAMYQTELQAKQAELAIAEAAFESAQNVLEAETAAGKHADDDAIAEAQARVDAARAEFESKSAAMEQYHEQHNLRIAEMHSNIEQLDFLLAQERTLNVEISEEAYGRMSEAEQAVYNYEQALQLLNDADGPVQQAAAVGALEAAWQDLITTTADGMGIDSKTLDDYTKHIMQTAGASDILSDSLANNQKMALKVAAATIRANEGFGKLEGGLDQIKADLDGINKQEIDISSQRAMESINLLDESLSDILNIDTSTLSMDMLLDPETIQLAEQALNGVEGALWALQSAAMYDIVGQWFPPESQEIMETSLSNLLQGIYDVDQALLEAGGSGWELGASLNDLNMDASVENIRANAAEIINGMTAMGASADDVRAAFASIGMEVEGKTEVVKTKHEIDASGTDEQVNISYDYATADTMGLDGQVQTRRLRVPKISRRTIPVTDKVEQEIEQEVFTFMSADGNYGGLNLTNVGSGGTSSGQTARAPANRGGGGRGTGGSAPAKDSGGGGGGGSESEPKKVGAGTGPKQMGERFRETNDELAEISRRLDRVSQAEEKAYGLNKLRLITQKNALLAQQAAKYAQLQKEAEAYLRGAENERANAGRRGIEWGNSMIIGGTDQSRINEMMNRISTGFANAGDFNFEAMFDSDGFLTNYEAILNRGNQILQEYFETYAQWDEETQEFIWGLDEAGQAAKDTYDELGDRFDKLQAQMDLNNDTAQQIQDAIQSQVDLLHEQLSNELQAINYKMELRISFNEFDLRRLQFLQDRLGDRAWSSRMDVINDKVQKYIGNARTILDGGNKLFKLQEKMAGAETPAELAGAFAEIGENVNISQEAFDRFKETGEMTEEMMSSFIDVMNKAQDTIEEFYAASTEMFSMYHDALQTFIGDFDRLIGKFDSNLSMIQSWQEIWNVAGKPWEDQRKAIELSNKAIQTQSARVQGLREKYEFMNNQLQTNAAEHAELVANTYGDDARGQADIEASRQALEQLKADVLAVKAEMLGGLAEVLNALKEEAALAAGVIRNEFVEGLSGIFSEVQSALDMFSQKSAIDNYFVNEESAGFRIAEMLRNAEKDMEGVTDPAILAEYAEWQDHLNGQIEKRTVMTQRLGRMVEEEIWVTREGVKLSETDLEIMQKEFELMKAQAAFEEQQQMKNTMRLSRDTSGNWSYVYSADGDQKEGQEEDIQKKIADIRALHRQAADEAAEMWLQVWAEYNNYVAEIDWQRYEQNEAYRKEVDTRMGWYQQQMDLHASTIEKHNAAIDRSFSDTTLSVIIDMDDMAAANDMYKRNTEEMQQALQQNWQEYQEKMAYELDLCGISMEDLSDVVTRETDDIIEDNARNMDDIRELRRTSEQELDLIMAKTRSWSETWRNEISQIIAALDALIAKIREMQAAQSGAGEVEGFNARMDYSAEIGRRQEAGSLTEAEARRLLGERYNKIQAIIDDDIAEWERNYDANGVGIDDATRERHREWIRDSQGASYGTAGKSQAEWIEEQLQAMGLNFNTGGLVSGPTIASLAEDGKKELVLNARDTENMLAAVQIMRDSIQQHLNGLGLSQASQIADAQSRLTSEQTINQPPVIIQADFPNVSAREEIEAAFNNLINQAAQYTLKPRE